MESITVSFFRQEVEVLRRQEIKFEEVIDPVTGNRIWYGEFYLSCAPPFDSEPLIMVLPDGRKDCVKVIVSNFMRSFCFVSFRSLLPIENKFERGK